MGHELRLKHGSGILSQRVLDRIAYDLRQGAQPAITIVDAIRNPGEVRVLRESLADEFMLVAIEAPVEVIIDRIRSRARAGDVLDDEEVARQVLAAELGLNEPDHGHNIAECIAMAEVRVENAGSLPQLRNVVDDFVDRQLVPHS